MNASRVDQLTRTLAAAGTRRTLLSWLAALPLAGALAARLEETGEAGGRRKRRKARHRHRTGSDKDNRKGQRKGQDTHTGKRPCAKAGQTPRTGKRGRCCKGLSADGTGRCAAPAPTPVCLQPTATSATQGLQEAIDAAADGATLTLCAGTWNLTSTVVIGKSLTLLGAGAAQTILDGGKPPDQFTGVRVLTVDAGTVMLQDLTITKAFANGPDPLGLGNQGGGIFNKGTLTLLGVSVTGNLATVGGGILNFTTGSVSLKAGSRVTGNRAFAFGGGITTYGDGVTMEAGSSVTDNLAQFSAGIHCNSTGTVTLKAGSSVTNNTATQTAGGVTNQGGADSVTVEADDIVTNNNPNNCEPENTIEHCIED